MYNTPPTYAIYIAGLVFNWIKAQGGLVAMEAHNRRKAALLYDYLDTTGFYSAPVAKDCRSLMNVPFKLKDEALDGAFLKGAEAARHGAAQGPPLGGRHARLHLQRHAHRRCAGAGGLHEGIRGPTWLSTATSATGPGAQPDLASGLSRLPAETYHVGKDVPIR
jgi:hypothetical protein